jgi:hypothetical protein
MTTTLQTTTQAEITHSGIGLSITTYLSDFDKIVIDVPILKYSYQNGVWGRHNMGTEKWRVEAIRYNLSNYDTQCSIDGIEGRGFTKAKTLRVRDEAIWGKTLIEYPEILAQIPDHFHEQAKAQFLIGANELLAKATSVLNNGLSTIPLKG